MIEFRHGGVVLRDPIAVAACQVLLGTGLVSVGIVFTQYLHDYLDSSSTSRRSLGPEHLDPLPLVLLLTAIVLPTLAGRTTTEAQAVSQKAATA